MGQKWTGGDIANYPGGGQKINLLKPVLAKWKDDTRKLVMFTDSYDVIFASTADEIITKFLDFEANAVFSAEGFCWPDKALAVCSLTVQSLIKFCMVVTMINFSVIEYLSKSCTWKTVPVFRRYV